MPGRPAVDVLKAKEQGQKRYGADADWGVLDGAGDWRHLANTIKLSMCGGDAVLCQITFPTCSCLLGRLLRVDLITVGTSVRPSTKSLSDFNKIWYAHRGR